MLKKVFYVIAAVLIVIWAVGFFVYALGALVHLVLIAAILLLAFRISRSSKKVPKERYERTPRKF
jgi:hypothetical protein